MSLDKRLKGKIRIAAASNAFLFWVLACFSPFTHLNATEGLASFGDNCEKLLSGDPQSSTHISLRLSEQRSFLDATSNELYQARNFFQDISSNPEQIALTPAQQAFFTSDLIIKGHRLAERWLRMAQAASLPKDYPVYLLITNAQNELQHTLILEKLAKENHKEALQKLSSKIEWIRLATTVSERSDRIREFLAQLERPSAEKQHQFLAQVLLKPARRLPIQPEEFKREQLLTSYQINEKLRKLQEIQKAVDADIKVSQAQYPLADFNLLKEKCLDLSQGYLEFSEALYSRFLEEREQEAPWESRTSTDLLLRLSLHYTKSSLFFGKMANLFEKQHQDLPQGLFKQLTREMRSSRAQAFDLFPQLFQDLPVNTRLSAELRVEENAKFYQSEIEPLKTKFLDGDASPRELRALYDALTRFADQREQLRRELNETAAAIRQKFDATLSRPDPVRIQQLHDLALHESDQARDASDLAGQVQLAIHSYETQLVTELTGGVYPPLGIEEKAQQLISEAISLLAEASDPEKLKTARLHELTELKNRLQGLFSRLSRLSLQDLDIDGIRKSLPQGDTINEGAFFNKVRDIRMRILELNKKLFLALKKATQMEKKILNEKLRNFPENY